MTEQLKDLFESFSDMDPTKQLEKIREIRNTRSIERPAVATKRRKKEHQKSEKKKDVAKQLLLKLSPEERQALLERLKK